MYKITDRSLRDRINANFSPEITCGFLKFTTQGKYISLKIQAVQLTPEICA